MLFCKPKPLSLKVSVINKYAAQRIFGELSTPNLKILKIISPVIYILCHVSKIAIV